VVTQVQLEPWLDGVLKQLLQSTQAHHAVLLHGPPGVGQFELAMATAQAWLCEAADPSPGQMVPACGLCSSCHLFAAHTHPDLLLLLPDVLRETLGWAALDEGPSADKASTAKASKAIKIEAVRRAVTFAQTTSSRGRVKVLVVHPAQQLNDIAANALLKTLEEPPGQARFILSSAAADALLPTLRSRCQAFPVPLPDAASASQWLAQQGVAQPHVLLAATGGQPSDALAWFKEGITAQAWLSLPQQLCQGQGATLANWPLPRVVQTMQKLCHDAMRLSVAAPPRYFSAEAWPANQRFDALALSAWSRQLQAQSRHAEHPWSQALAVQTLVNEAACVLTCRTSPAPRKTPLSRAPHDSAGIR
jgi:DNA polymerase III subunit delta'